jgi:hypothetical protein
MSADTDEALTEPLVNVRYALKCALADQIVTASDAAALLAAAASLYFTHRTYAGVCCTASRSVDGGAVARFREYVADRGRQLDLKRLDALVAIAHVNTALADGRHHAHD